VHCGRPVGAPLATAAPGVKTFGITSVDRAGNTATATRTYRVVAPSLAPAPAPELHDGFDFACAGRSTRFTRLLVKDAPRGATIR
jgi:hypothetical protein